MKTLKVAAALGLGVLLGPVTFVAPAAAAQTCTGRSVAIDRTDVDQRVHDGPALLADDLSDAPSSLYARRPQRGRIGR